MREAKTGRKEGEKQRRNNGKDGGEREKKNERGEGDEMREEGKYMYMYEDQSVPVSLATVLPLSCKKVPTPYSYPNFLYRVKVYYKLMSSHPGAAK